MWEGFFLTVGDAVSVPIITLGSHRLPLQTVANERGSETKPQTV